MCKEDILNRLCYTDLVFRRINKKLRTEMTRTEIETLMRQLIEQSDSIEKIGKNSYITSNGIRITINFFTMRVITVDRV